MPSYSTARCAEFGIWDQAVNDAATELAILACSSAVSCVLGQVRHNFGRCQGSVGLVDPLPSAVSTAPRHEPIIRTDPCTGEKLALGLLRPVFCTWVLSRGLLKRCTTRYGQRHKGHYDATSGSASKMRKRKCRAGVRVA